MPIKKKRPACGHRLSPKRLKAMRRECGFSQHDLAIVLDVYPLTVSRWERGVTPISVRTALAMDAVVMKYRKSYSN